MQTWEIVERAQAPDGTELVLARRGTEWVVRAGGHVLMGSRAHGSEETLAAYALERVKEPKQILVGGLGLGFTLRAALNGVPRETRVTVAELLPELVQWNHAHVGDLAKRPLDDGRVRVHVGDVFDRITAAAGDLDLILLDVDNGPAALAHAKNSRLYGDMGAHACWSALRMGGVLALWSAGKDERYVSRLGRAGFDVEVKSVAARQGSGARHVLFLATKVEARLPHATKKPAPPVKAAEVKASSKPVRTAKPGKPVRRAR